jgi:hypothetical protein
LIIAGTAAWMLFTFVGQAAPRPPAPPQRGSITVRQQFIIRVPRGAQRVVPAGSSLIQWRESRGPRCLQATSIMGATLLGQNSVDLILRDNSRVRARLENRCPALDYYRGFYVNATQDGRICADRDAIRSRAGGSCTIDQFRVLRPSPR